MSEKKPIIARVRLNASNGQKVITVPKDSDIKSGEYVEIRKVKFS